MEKLINGQYCKHLTKEQFNELINIENHEYKLTYKSIDYETENYYKHSLRFDGNILDHGCKRYCNKELSFDDFKQKAINTFKN